MSMCVSVLLPHAAVGTEDTSYGRWQAEWGPPEDPEQPQRWLFASQQVRLTTWMRACQGMRNGVDVDAQRESRQ